MAILSFVKDSTILENNIVQTVASAAGTLSAIIFTLPGHCRVVDWISILAIISDLCSRGRARGAVHHPAATGAGDELDLPYPEGVAAAEVLKVGSGTRGKQKTKRARRAKA